MAKFNIKKMLIGLVFFILAMFCAVTVFYLLEVKPKMAARKQTGIEQRSVLKSSIDQDEKLVPEKPVKKNITNTIKSRAKQISDKFKKKLAEQEPKETLGKAKDIDKSISVKALFRESVSVYDDEEKSRREGLLWVDRTTKRFMVTLGLVHGLTKGSKLNVYESDVSIGQVKVDTAFDVISFVLPVEKDLDLSKQNYYKIIIE